MHYFVSIRSHIFHKLFIYIRAIHFTYDVKDYLSVIEKNSHFY